MRAYLSGVMALLLLSGLSGLAGCGHSVDIRMRNPLVVRGVDPNRIVKTHNFIARDRGIPPQSMQDEAALVMLDSRQACFAVTLHELAAIDLSRVQATLEVSGFANIEQAQVSPGQATAQTFQGHMPQRRQVGMETYCSYWVNGYCQAWSTRPVYTIVDVPALISVYQTCGQICMPHGGAITPATPWITLVLRLPVLTYDAAYAASGVFGGSGTKKIAFRWGFLAAQQQ